MGEEKIAFFKKEVRTEAKQDKVMKGKKAQKENETKQQFEAIGKEVAEELKKEEPKKRKENKKRGESLKIRFLRLNNLTFHNWFMSIFLYG
mgnify:CR=1 FL=1